MCTVSEKSDVGTWVVLLVRESENEDDNEENLTLHFFNLLLAASTEINCGKDDAGHGGIGHG